MTTVALPGKNNARMAAFPHLAVRMSAESNALAATTIANWLDVTSWRNNSNVPGANADTEQAFESYPQFEIDIECDATETLTSPELYAVRLGPVTIADDTFTSSGSDDINTATAHAMLTGDGPMRLTTSGTLPAGLSTDTDYYVRYLSANTFSLHPTRADAIADTNSVATSDTGSGTHTIADVQSSANLDDDTRRVRLTKIGDLNEGNTITVGAQTAYMERINHSPLDLYYALVATSGTGAQTLEVRLTPVMAIEE